MKLVCEEIHYSFEIKENKVPIYIIENPKFYLHLLLSLKEEIDENKEGIFSLFEETKELKLSKNVLFIGDLLHLDFHNRKIVSAIFHQLKEYTLKDEIYAEKLEMEGVLKGFLYRIIDNFSYPLEMEDNIEYEDLFKLFHIHISEDYDSYLEKLIDYLTLSYDLDLMKCVIFVNLKTILGEDECRKLYQQCFYKKIPIILFENREYEYTIKEEEKIIVDFDLCEIRL
ncbi:type II-A CRISPR-associated protein Csn2 [Fusobacterium necrophorum]|uniref:Type II-A CRISPR-associated protein Csn2 n=1 Tax=Fusobacterium necrophorum TaxID=859 RepID=A0A4Q2L4D7_9FUSO|nr:type II-A CRISPR-associated protein Csn2 [Fusobacterium necrophorum]RXZ71323.1 type II-A CRISPR-associated protein Csn2 [Fusobacterium necrophorum]